MEYSALLLCYLSRRLSFHDGRRRSIFVSLSHVHKVKRMQYIDDVYKYYYFYLRGSMSLRETVLIRPGSSLVPGLFAELGHLASCGLTTSPKVIVHGDDVIIIQAMGLWLLP